jgi:AraC family transcriptional regulator, exoenzyme S synthesis regulatory protein ExsA
MLCLLFKIFLIYIEGDDTLSDLFVYDLNMTENAINNFVHLRMNMFSFLQKGEKIVRFAESSVVVNKNQFIILKAGNRVLTEKINFEELYYCKLLFFSNKKVERFLIKNSSLFNKTNLVKNQPPFYCIEVDDYISNFISSLTALDSLLDAKQSRLLLEIKFEELIVYLISKIGQKFVDFLCSLGTSPLNINFRHVIETNVYVIWSFVKLHF